MGMRVLFSMVMFVFHTCPLWWLWQEYAASWPRSTFLLTRPTQDQVLHLAHKYENSTGAIPGADKVDGTPFYLLNYCPKYRGLNPLLYDWQAEYSIQASDCMCL